MKKRNWMVLMVVITMLALAACSNAKEETATSETVTVPEASSGELLVDSLEYLLSEEENTVQEESMTGEEVTIYYGNGASSALNTEITAVEQLSAENLISALATHNIVSLDTKVNSFEEKEVDGNKTLYLDLSNAFCEYLKTMTQEGENVIIASVTDTFLEAYNADAIVLMVDGAVLETSYATYEEPLQFYTWEQMTEAKAESVTE